MHYTDTLAQRLRALADEVESAERYGLPIPTVMSAYSFDSMHASFSATVDEFDAWADYTEAAVVDYVHDGVSWSRASADVNGLLLEFAVKRAAVESSAVSA